MNAYPLNTKEVQPRANLTRVGIALRACAITALMYRHLSHLRSTMSGPRLSITVALVISDLTLAFMWACSQVFRYRPVRRRAYPENLVRVVDVKDLPRLDVFVYAADACDPMVTANTVLSVLGFDYPLDKLAVYVADDCGSQLTLFALVEAARFAKHWLPFCREHRISMRCPEVFFNDDDESSRVRCSKEEMENIKILYERMKMRVKSVMERGQVYDDMISSKEEHEAFKKWETGFTLEDHSTIIQVVVESNKEVDISAHHLSNLIYLAREKRKGFPHNFKSGALNVSIRVSAVMTNAPIVLALNSYMYSNDPQTPRRALCHLLDPIDGPKLAFVQFPPCYTGINKNDTYNSEYKRSIQINAEGLDGFGIVDYVGTGSFFHRKALHKDNEIDQGLINSIPVLELAHKVSLCDYEQGTSWGLTMGFRYGTLVEDFFTGYRLQCEGWSSALCNPPTPAFIGEISTTLSDSLVQLQHWLVGFLEVAFSKYCPLIYGTKNNSLAMGLAYGFYCLWPFWSIPILTYGFLPQLSLLCNIYVFPKVSDRWFYLYGYLFLSSYIEDFAENLLYGTTFKKWWNEQRMWMIRGATSFFFALTKFLLKRIGVTALDLNFSSKAIDSQQKKLYKEEIFDFGVETPLFIPVSVVSLLNLVSFAWGVMKVLRDGNLREMFVQLFISGFVVVNSWPIYEAMLLRRDGWRMPTRITLISIVLTWILCFIVVFH